QISIAISRRRRSTMSATTPAGRATRQVGSAVADWTSATSRDDLVSSVISQAAPTLCIQTPVLAETLLSHSRRKPARRRGSAGRAIAPVRLGDDRGEVLIAVATRDRALPPALEASVSGSPTPPP